MYDMCLKSVPKLLSTLIDFVSLTVCCVEEKLNYMIESLGIE